MKAILEAVILVTAIIALCMKIDDGESEVGEEPATDSFGV